MSRLELQRYFAGTKRRGSAFDRPTPAERKRQPLPHEAFVTDAVVDMPKATLYLALKRLAPPHMSARQYAKNNGE